MSKLHVIEQVQQYQCKPITVLLKVIMSRTWIFGDKLFSRWDRFCTCTRWKRNTKDYKVHV